MGKNKRVSVGGRSASARSADVRSAGARWVSGVAMLAGVLATGLVQEAVMHWPAAPQAAVWEAAAWEAGAPEASPGRSLAREPVGVGIYAYGAAANWASPDSADAGQGGPIRVDGAADGEADLRARIAALIDQLGAVESSRRLAAVEELVRIGMPAHDALVKAQETGLPQVRTLASRVLVRLPWYWDDADPPEVKSVLKDLGSKTIDERVAAVELLVQQGQQGRAALVRLLRYDPSSTVRWVIASEMRGTRGAYSEMLREIEPSPDNAAMLSAVGWAWLPLDGPRAYRLMERSLENAERSSEAAQAEQLLMLDMLVESARAQGRGVDALRHARQMAAMIAVRLDRPEVLRRPAPRGLQRQVNIGAVKLLAVHGEFGTPLSLARDIPLLTGEIVSPLTLYSLAAMCERRSAFAGSVMETVAWASSLTAVPVRLQVGAALDQVGWKDAARREYFTVASLGFFQPTPLQYWGVEAAKASARAEDDFRAMARVLQFAARLHWDATGLGRAVDGTDVGVLELRLAQVAEERGDRAAAIAHAKRFAASGALEVDYAVDGVPLLRRLGLDAEASAMFAKAEEASRERLRAALDNRPNEARFERRRMLRNVTPKAELATEYNDLAWLLARSGEKPKEALELVDKALEIEPDNAAFIDTRAEAEFQLGNSEVAAELEERALRLRPGDRFMLKQLERFRRGK